MLRPTRPRASSLRAYAPLFALVTAVLCSAVLAASCSASSDGSDGNGGTGAGHNTGAGGTGIGGTGIGGWVLGGSGGGNPTQGLIVTPPSAMIQVEYGVAGVQQQFHATDINGNAVNPAWSLNTPQAGTIDQTGLFTANGQAGGTITVVAKLGDQIGQATLSISLHILENPANLQQPQIDLLTAPGGTADPNWTIVYPYGGTVFPRGIPAPQIHSNGLGAASAIYLHITMTGCEYQGFLPPAAQVAMSQGAWDALGTCTTGLDAPVDMAKLVNGQKVGPLSRMWRIAQGKLHGFIYYNTYDSQLAGYTGAMMRISGTSTTPEVLVGNCTVCHSVSSDGSTAAAANHSYPSPGYSGGVFDLSGGQLNPPLVWGSTEQAAFAALYPINGEVLVVNAAPGGSWPPNTPGTPGSWPSSLLLKTGQPVPNSGIESYYAQSPAFSHDGTMLAFCDRNYSNTALSTLALMSYDNSTHAFSNHQILATPQGGHHLAWPAFTPDSKFVVYQDGVGEDLATWGNNTGKIYMVGVQTAVVTFPAKLNGDGYMPAGARDENLNYEPTILPIATGGYFWVMFTSRRTYGNVLTSDRSVTKRLWVSAFDANAQDGQDPSHPAFYISGQELTSGNSRGFWALDPCRQDGQPCESGDECCNGFCNPDPNSTGFICGQPSGDCSHEFEPCVTAADCCDPQMECLGGRCAILPPQ